MIKIDNEIIYNLQAQSMEQWLDILLLVIQSSLFLLGRILDDLSWYDLGVPDEVNVFQGVGVASMSLSVIIKVIRNWKIPDIIKILFWKSQLQFVISWSLVILLVILFFNIFGCQTQMPETDLVYFYVLYDGCCINATQVMLTNLNFSLISNTKAYLAELILCEIILFGEIIFNGNLLLLFVNNLVEKPKDYALLYVSIAIANQMLIMDLLLRSAYEEKEAEKKKEEQKEKQKEEYISIMKAQITKRMTITPTTTNMITVTVQSNQISNRSLEQFITPIKDKQ